MIEQKDVDAACLKLLANGERPSRPRVQELLEQSDKRKKGSNAQVQRYVNDFWERLARQLGAGPRAIAGVPEEFGPALDKALLDLVQIARTLASSEFADKEAALADKAIAMERSVGDAQAMAAEADRLRSRAEGELAGIQGQVQNLELRLAEANSRCLDQDRKIDALLRGADVQAVESRRLQSALEAAQTALEKANSRQRTESNQLLQQLDNARQEAKREAERLGGLLDQARREAGSIREQKARLEAEVEAANGTVDGLRSQLNEEKSQRAAAESKWARAEQDAAAMGTRYETAEQLRQEAVALATDQANQIGRKERDIEQLKRDLAAAQRKGKERS